MNTVKCSSTNIAYDYKVIGEYPSRQILFESRRDGSKFTVHEESLSPARQQLGIFALDVDDKYRAVLARHPPLTQRVIKDRYYIEMGRCLFCDQVYNNEGESQLMLIGQKTYLSYWVCNKGRRCRINELNPFFTKTAIEDWKQIVKDNGFEVK